MYRLTESEAVTKLGSDAEKGLDAAKVNESREKFGKNELEAKKKTPIIVKFFLEFKDLLVIILLIAAIVSLIVDPGEWVESAIIFAVVIINAVLGVYQENKAEKSLEALKNMSAPKCKVLREGRTDVIDSKELVVGDIIVTEAGDFIPADARILECSNFTVDESALTGESVAVTKNTGAIKGEDIPLGDKKNSVFSSTFVTNGRAKSAVTAVGMNTEIGKIAGMLQSGDDSQTPLQRKLAQVGKVIGILSIVICIVVFALEYFGGLGALDAFKTAVALAVAAIPEGLATVVTIVLAIGVGKMVKKNAIVKKLPAVETLGSTSIVCSDKTGTLTQNKMTVVEIFRGGIKKAEEADEKEGEMLRLFALCCDAKIEKDENGGEKRIGDPTETALIDANLKYGMDLSAYQRIGDLPFDSDRKMMTVVCKYEGGYVSITKGAPDVVLSRCEQGAETERGRAANDGMSDRALRVLGLAVKYFKEAPDVNEELEKDMQFIGLVGMIDPARPEVKAAIAEAKKAGIRTVMITGDHIKTASAIARELGILQDGQKAVASEELSRMSDQELFEHIEEYSVYARVAPKDKVRIVEAWQKKGKVVAMTGDGVNDSPALKRADIGCAMGITGTDVSKEAADMILTDDNFATIISAVKEGRGIYANIKKCVKYLLSSNIGEVITIFAASVISLFSSVAIGVPLLPIHLLWINLITDSLPAFGLGMDEPENGIMNAPPRDKNESFFAGNLGFHIALEGFFIGALTLAAYLIGNVALGDHGVGQTMAFLTLSTCQLFHAFNVKSDRSLFNRGTLKNKHLNLAFVAGFALQMCVIYIPGLNSLFKLTPLGLGNFAICMGLAASIMVIMEIYKLIKRIVIKRRNAQ